MSTNRITARHRDQDYWTPTSAPAAITYDFHLTEPTARTGGIEAEAKPAYRGRFRKGYDPRRHRFTREECIAGFWTAIISIVTRYPDAINADGHMVRHFLPSITGQVISRRRAA